MQIESENCLWENEFSNEIGLLKLCKQIVWVKKAKKDFWSFTILSEVQNWNFIAPNCFYSCNEKRSLSASKAYDWQFILLLQICIPRASFVKKHFFNHKCIKIFFTVFLLLLQIIKFMKFRSFLTNLHNFWNLQKAKIPGRKNRRGWKFRFPFSRRPRQVFTDVAKQRVTVNSNQHAASFFLASSNQSARVVKLEIVLKYLRFYKKRLIVECDERLPSLIKFAVKEQQKELPEQQLLMEPKLSTGTTSATFASTRTLLSFLFNLLFKDFPLLLHKAITVNDFLRLKMCSFFCENLLLKQ